MLVIEEFISGDKHQPSTDSVIQTLRRKAGQLASIWYHQAPHVITPCCPFVTASSSATNYRSPCEPVEPVSDGDKARLSGPSVCRKPGAVTSGARLPRYVITQLARGARRRPADRIRTSPGHFPSNMDRIPLLILNLLAHGINLGLAFRSEFGSAAIVGFRRWLSSYSHVPDPSRQSSKFTCRNSSLEKQRWRLTLIAGQG